MTPEADGPVDKVHLTQVGRALSRLGVEHIPAYSPEARGRSERMFGTLQDRLVKELALAQICDLATANNWIKKHYLPEHNRLFGHAPRVSDNAFVAVAYSDLVETLCSEHERIVSRDNTVSWEGLRLQVPESPLRAHYVKARVKVRQYPDGRLALFHGPRRIAQFDADGSPTAMPGNAVPARSSKAAFSSASRDAWRRRNALHGRSDGHP